MPALVTLGEPQPVIRDRSDVFPEVSSPVCSSKHLAISSSPYRHRRCPPPHAGGSKPKERYESGRMRSACSDLCRPRARGGFFLVSPARNLCSQVRPDATFPLCMGERRLGEGYRAPSRHDRPKSINRLRGHFRLEQAKGQGRIGTSPYTRGARLAAPVGVALPLRPAVSLRSPTSTEKSLLLAGDRHPPSFSPSPPFALTPCTQ